MATWVLVFFMSSGFGAGATGGPLLIDGFTSEVNCKAALSDIQNLPKFDFGKCVKIVK